MSPPVGHGVDLVEVARIRASLANHGERFRDKCFTPREQQDAERSGSDRAPERYAARFAAKEAVLKALGTGWARGVGWTDIEVVCNEQGAPGIELSGVASDIAAAQGVSAWLCSLSHTADHAMASVIAIGG